MASESNRVEIRLQNDPWLLRAVVGAVEHFAHRAGIDEEGCQNLIVATDEACQNTFRLLPTDNGTLCVAIQDFPDRVEVRLEHHGEALPTAGLETFFGFGGEGESPGDLSGLLLMARVDRVLYDSEGDTSSMTLVKYCPAKK